MPDRPARARSWSIFLVSWLVFTLMSSLWALATPPSASPDEPAHLIRAASVVRGQFNNADYGSGSVVTAPAVIAWSHAQTCPAFNAEVTAACIPPFVGDPSELTESTTTAGRYNPLYYLLVGWPSLMVDGPASITAMRLVSGALTSVFLALTVLVVAGWSRRLTPVIAFGAGVTPMLLFLSGSVNPNAVEVTTTLAAFAAMAAVITRPDPALLARHATIIAVSGVVAANARAISPVWLAIALLVPLLLATRDQVRQLMRRRSVIVAASVVAAGTLAALIWLRATNSVSTSADAGGEARDVPYAGSSPFVGIALMAVRFGQHLREMIGVFGWLDTSAPLEVYALWGLLFGSLVVWSIAILRGRALAFALVLIVAVPVVPALIQGAFITSGGWIWQGRYALPLLVVALLGLGIALADAAARLPHRARAILAGAAAAIWVFGQVWAFTGAMQRYTVGADGTWIEMVTAPEWQPPGGVVPLLVAYALVAVGAGALGWRMAAPPLGAVKQVSDDVESTLAR